MRAPDTLIGEYGDGRFRYPARVLTAVPTSTTLIELTPDELTMVHNALTAFLADFGHHEYQLRRQIRDILAKIPG